MVIGILIGATVEGVSYVKRRRALKKLEASNETSQPQPIRHSPPQPNRRAVHREPEDNEDGLAPPPYDRTGEVVIIEGRHRSCVEGAEVDQENEDEGMPPGYWDEMVPGYEREEMGGRRTMEMGGVDGKNGHRLE
jgi:hypothetical protein